MDRSIVYPAQQPTAETWLGAERAKMVSQGFLSQAVLGSNTVVDGLLCTPTTPASLAVNISPGSIYATAPVDSSVYGSLAADPSKSITKQGILSSPASLTLVPPVAAGYSINYLIQAAFSEVDTDNIVLPYFNSNNPLVPLSGPSGSGASQPTWRRGAVALVAKGGVAASSGSQITPAPDPGYVGICVVTVANGATQITSGNISKYAPAPYVGVKLPDVPKWVQAASYAWAQDNGSANAIVAVMDPPVTAYTPGLRITIRKINSPNTGAMTIDIGAGAVSLRDYTGAVLTAGSVPGGSIIEAVYNGSTFNMVGGNASFTNVTNLTANSGDGIEVTNAGAVNFRVSRGTQDSTIEFGDIWPRGDGIDGTLRYVNTFELIEYLRKNVVWPVGGESTGFGPQSITFFCKKNSLIMIDSFYEGGEETVAGWPSNYIVGSLRVLLNGGLYTSQNIRCYLNWIDIWSAGRQNLTAPMQQRFFWSAPSDGSYTFQAVAKKLDGTSNYNNTTRISAYGVNQ